MVIADRRPGKGANGLEPAESGADHDHMMTVQGRVHAILFTCCLGGPINRVLTGFATSLHEPPSGLLILSFSRRCSSLTQQ